MLPCAPICQRLLSLVQGRLVELQQLGNHLWLSQKSICFILVGINVGRDYLKGFFQLS